MGNALVTEGLELSFCQLPQATFEPREGHVFVQANRGLVCFGGNSQTAAEDDAGDTRVYVLGENEQAWTVKGQAPHRMGGASAVINDKVYVFGGISPEQGCWLADILVYNVSSGTTEVLPASFDGPSPRDKCALVAVGGNLFLFGGFGPQVAGESDGGEEESDEDDPEEDPGMDPAKFKWFNDLYVYSVENKKWRLCHTKNPPPVRAAHSMCLSGGRLWIFGGKSLGGRVNDLWSIKVADVLQNNPEMAWEQHTPQGVAPAGRSFHSLVAVPNSNRLLLFGGVDNGDAKLSDLHVYDPEVNGWAQPSFVGGTDKVAGFLGAVTVKDSTLYLNGGPVLASLDMTPIVSAKITVPPPPEEGQK
jgi:amphiphysin